jgi:hypothetical protein
LPVNSVVAAEVLMMIRFRSRPTCCTASATAEFGMSMTMSTRSVSIQRRARAAPTSGLFWWSPPTTSIGLPSARPPLWSSAAIRAATTEPGPAKSA